MEQIKLLSSGEGYRFLRDIMEKGPAKNMESTHTYFTTRMVTPEQADGHVFQFVAIKLALFCKPTIFSKSVLQKRE